MIPPTPSAVLRFAHSALTRGGYEHKENFKFFDRNRNRAIVRYANQEAP
jgi:hypothetical protein